MSAAEMEPGAAPAGGAAEQRAALMGDAVFRSAAVNPASAQWAQLQGLDRSIAESLEAAQEEVQQPPQVKPSAEPDEGDADAAATALFRAPTTPSAYEFPTRQAQDRGLLVDFAAETELKAALHGAGVDQALAASLYTAAIGAASGQRNDVQIESDRITSEQGLRGAWRGHYDENVALARAEARRIFATLPASITGGADYENWIESSGMGSSAPLIKMLAARGRMRAKR